MRPGRLTEPPSEPNLHDPDHDHAPEPRDPEARGFEARGFEARGFEPRGFEPRDPDLRTRVVSELEAVRRRSLAYTDVDEDELVRQHSPLMSPLVWDLAHIGNYEDLWLVRALGQAAATRPGLDGVYDAFRHDRASRARLSLLGPEGSRAYLREVRARAFELLDHLDPALAHGDDGTRARLLTGGFVYGMVIQHEHQHDETMLATHQLRIGAALLAAGLPAPPGRPVARREVLVPAGPFTFGTSDDPWAYDNERPAHRVDLPAFWIDTLPVSNRAQLAFLEAGGYDDERLWSSAGWDWRQREGLTAPAFWWRDGDTWLRRRLGHVEPVPLDEPVQHVCWYEAEAHARWAGRRLPTEAEWEKAAAHDPATGRSHRYPWGDTAPTPDRANLGHRTSGPAPLGAYPAGASPCGAEQMIGDVWEWTASGFTPHPGFRSHPYREYSEVFFPKDGESSAFRVLRGGSWATGAPACRATFRNWDYPIRRQIFAGFRLARDAD